MCLFVCTITSERLNIGWWNLAVRCTVQKSRPSSYVNVKGQGHRDKKQRSAESSPMHSYACSVCSTQQAQTIRSALWCHSKHDVTPLSACWWQLRWWENQRMLSSWGKVLHPTQHAQHKKGHFGDVPQANLLAWYGKTKPNTTKACIHQSKNVLQQKNKHKKLKPGLLASYDIWRFINL